jgi:hypothetical protein
MRMIVGTVEALRLGRAAAGGKSVSSIYDDGLVGLETRRVEAPRADAAFRMTRAARVRTEVAAAAATGLGAAASAEAEEGLEAAGSVEAGLGAAAGLAAGETAAAEGWEAALADLRHTAR